MDLETLIRNGIDWISRHPDIPDHWPHLIRLGDLRMDYGEDCVLGQLATALLPPVKMSIGVTRPAHFEEAVLAWNPEYGCGFYMADYRYLGKHVPWLDINDRWSAVIAGLRETAPQPS